MIRRACTSAFHSNCSRLPALRQPSSLPARLSEPIGLGSDDNDLENRTSRRRQPFGPFPRSLQRLCCTCGHERPLEACLILLGGTSVIVLHRLPCNLHCDRRQLTLSMAAAPRLRAGCSAADFRTLETVYANAGSIVYKAVRLADHTLVALKQRSTPELGRGADALHEAKILASGLSNCDGEAGEAESSVAAADGVGGGGGGVRHPHIVQTLGYYWVDTEGSSGVHDRRGGDASRSHMPSRGGALVLVLEWADGGDLLALLRKRAANARPLPERCVWEWTAQLLSAVAALHKRRLVHRDIKSSNVLLFSSGGRGAASSVDAAAGAATSAPQLRNAPRALGPESCDDPADRWTAKLADLGVAREMAAEDEVLTSLYGTPLYLAPELCGPGRPRYSSSADLWSVGVVMYEMAALRPPFTGSNMFEVAMAVRRGKYPSLPSTCSRELSAFISTLLAAAPERRPTAAEALVLCRACAAGAKMGALVQSNVSDAGIRKPSAPASATAVQAAGAHSVTHPRSVGRGDLVATHHGATRTAPRTHAEVPLDQAQRLGTHASPSPSPGPRRTQSPIAVRSGRRGPDAARLVTCDHLAGARHPQGSTTTSVPIASSAAVSAAAHHPAGLPSRRVVRVKQRALHHPAIIDGVRNPSSTLAPPMQQGRHSDPPEAATRNATRRTRVAVHRRSCDAPPVSESEASDLTEPGNVRVLRDEAVGRDRTGEDGRTIPWHSRERSATACAVVRPAGRLPGSPELRIIAERVPGDGALQEASVMRARPASAAAERARQSSPGPLARSSSGLANQPALAMPVQPQPQFLDPRLHRQMVQLRRERAHAAKLRLLLVQAIDAAGGDGAASVAAGTWIVPAACDVQPSRIGADGGHSPGVHGAVSEQRILLGDELRRLALLEAHVAALEDALGRAHSAAMP